MIAAVVEVSFAGSISVDRLGHLRTISSTVLPRLRLRTRWTVITLSSAITPRPARYSVSRGSLAFRCVDLLGPAGAPTPVGSLKLTHRVSVSPAIDLDLPSLLILVSPQKVRKRFNSGQQLPTLPNGDLPGQTPFANTCQLLPSTREHFELYYDV